MNIWYHFSKQVEATKMRYLQSQIAKTNSWKLLEQGIFHLSQVADLLRTLIFSQEWVEADQLGFVGVEILIWNDYCTTLKIIHVRIKEEK